MALAYGGVSLTVSGIITALIIFILIDVAVIIAMKKNAVQGLLFVDLTLSILFTVLEWIPVYFGTVIAFIFALMGAAFVRDYLSGNRG